MKAKNAAAQATMNLGRWGMATAFVLFAAAAAQAPPKQDGESGLAGGEATEHRQHHSDHLHQVDRLAEDAP